MAISIYLRSRGYYLAIVGVSMGFSFWLYGFIFPFWIVNNEGEQAGFWTCSRLHENTSLCRLWPGRNDTINGNVLTLVKLSSVTGLSGLLFTLGHILIGSFGIKCSLLFSTELSVPIFLSAVFGCANVAAFMYETFQFVPPNTDDGTRYGCAFGVYVTGCVLALMSAVIFCHIEQSAIRQLISNVGNADVDDDSHEVRWSVQHAQSCPYGREGEGDPLHPGAVYVTQLGYAYDNE